MSRLSGKREGRPARKILRSTAASRSAGLQACHRPPGSPKGLRYVLKRRTCPRRDRRRLSCEQTPFSSATLACRATEKRERTAKFCLAGISTKKAADVQPPPK